MINFRRHVDADRRIRSAIAAAKAILPLDLYPSHKRQLLRVVLWKLTEAEGESKYQTRYRTESALTAAAVQHDHVVQQASLLDAICAFPEAAEELLNCAVACTVAVHEHDALTEHSRLNPGIDGWNRYAALGFAVIDTSTGAPADLGVLAKRHEHPLLVQLRTTSPRPSTWRALFDEFGIKYELSRDQVANSVLSYRGSSLHLYFHDRVRKPASFSANERFFASFSWDGWERLAAPATKGYRHVAPEEDGEREAIAAMLKYATTRA